MGSCYVSHRLDGEMALNDVRQKFAELQDIDRYENGHSYSGGIGMASGLLFPTTAVFASRQAADDWLSNNCEKWREAKAVRYTDDAGNTLWLVGAICSS